MEKHSNIKHQGKTEYQREVLQRIKDHRIEDSLSQKNIADFLDISYGQIGNIESANQPHKYTLSQISRLCREYGYSISQLFTGNPDCSKEELVDAIVRYEEGEK